VIGGEKYNRRFSEESYGLGCRILLCVEGRGSRFRLKSWVWRVGGIGWMMCVFCIGRVVGQKQCTESWER